MDIDWDFHDVFLRERDDGLEGEKRISSGETITNLLEGGRGVEIGPDLYIT